MLQGWGLQSGDVGFVPCLRRTLLGPTPISCHALLGCPRGQLDERATGVRRGCAVLGIEVEVECTAPCYRWRATASARGGILHSASRVQLWPCLLPNPRRTRRGGQAASAVPHLLRRRLQPQEVLVFIVHNSV